MQKIAINKDLITTTPGGTPMLKPAIPKQLIVNTVANKTAQFSKNMSVGGEAFNKSLIDAPLNTSSTKQSCAFSKAKRFSNVNVNDQGFAISVLGS